MRIITASVDNDRFYANASFIPSIEDEAERYANGLSNQQLIDMINEKNTIQNDIGNVHDFKFTYKIKYDFIHKFTNDRPRVQDYVSPWGPQYTIAPDTEEVDGRTFITCKHNIEQAEDGYVCLSCGKFVAASVPTTFVYQVGEENDWYVAEDSNPELLGNSFRRRKDDLDEYTTEYKGWTIKGEYVELTLDDINDEYKEHEKVTLNEDVNDDALDGDSGAEITTGITGTIYCKDATEQDPEEVKFWKRMVWLVGHSPKNALGFCKNHSNCEWFDKETKDWVWTMIKDENTPKFKYAQFLMMQARKYLATHEMPIMEKEEPKATSRYTDINTKVTDSYKYPGKKYIEVKCVVDGKYNVTLKHVDGCGNWISSHKNMTTETMNSILKLANV